LFFSRYISNSNRFKALNIPIYIQSYFLSSIIYAVDEDEFFFYSSNNVFSVDSAYFF
jgi:hypothetical protein